MIPQHKIVAPLKRMRRLALALLDACLPTKDSYSQHGEDRFILGQLGGARVDAIYCEVGANQPTRISNTYLFYRKGYHGFLIEPNPELQGLLRLVRPRDRVVPVGAGSECEVKPFVDAGASVLSHFDREGWRAGRLLPVLPLDTILKNVPDTLFLLSIDTEGMDLDVLRGAVQTLSKTLYVVVEANDESEAEQIDDFMRVQAFRPVGTLGCNLIFKSERTTVRAQELIA